MPYFHRLSRIFFYIFIFLLPWQTKLILRPSASNFTEISLYLSQFFLVLALALASFTKADGLKFFWRSPLAWILSAWSALLIISAFWAPDGNLALWRGFVFILSLGIFAWLNLKHKLDSVLFPLRDMKAFFILLSSIFLQALLGLYQFLTQSSFACKYFGLAFHDPSAPGTSVVETAAGRWLRAYGGLDHPNILGGVLALMLLAVAYMLAREKVVKRREEAARSAALFIFYFVSLFALFFTFSRSAWLAFALGLLILFIYLLFEKDRFAIGRFLVLIGFSICLLFIAARPYSDLVSVRLSAASRLEQKSLSERQAYIKEASVLISRSPVWGSGAGNYLPSLAGRSQAAQPVHNAWLLLAAENGILACLLFLATLLLVFKKSRLAALPAAWLVAILIIMMFDHWLLSLPFGLMLLFLLLGLM